MHIPKKYLRDKLVLLLVSGNAFLAMLLILIVVLLPGTSSSASSYCVEYRANLGKGFECRTGNTYPLLYFAAFGLLVLITNVMLSIRTYNLRRSLSLVILSLGALLLLLAVIVRYALWRFY